jgi:hypothetical protein
VQEVDSALLPTPLQEDLLTVLLVCLFLVVPRPEHIQVAAVQVRVAVALAPQVDQELILQLPARQLCMAPEAVAEMAPEEHKELAATEFLRG